MRFEFKQFIELPPALVFAFHENPAGLALLHRGWSDFRLLRHDGGLALGNRTWFEITVVRIIPVALGFEHTLYEPPFRFGERLIHGPFRRFIHVHEFTGSGAGTLITDHLDIELPWYYGGEVMMRLLAKPFRQRGAALLRLAQSSKLT